MMTHPITVALVTLTVGTVWLTAVLPGDTSAASKREGLRAFAEMAKVLTHPRCVNCHQDQQPRVRNGKRKHLPRLRIGDDGFGVGGSRCSICHRDENNPKSRIPGAAVWRMPPYSMSWNGLEPADICENIKDKDMNGGRDLAALVAHLEHDTLVVWAWSPGAERKPPPSTHKGFVALARAWIASGAPCPDTPAN